MSERESERVVEEEQEREGARKRERESEKERERGRETESGRKANSIVKSNTASLGYHHRSHHQTVCTQLLPCHWRTASPLEQTILYMATAAYPDPKTS